MVGIGPSAKAESFIKENPSQKEDPRWQAFLERLGKDKFKVDFVGFAKSQLIESGVPEKNIFDSEIDTVKDKRFFSHVREGNIELVKQGRFACVVGIMD